MSKTRTEKAASVAAVVSALTGAKGVAFVRFAGLTVKDVTTLRRRCRAAGVQYFVVKKTLLKVALEKAGVTTVNPRELTGNIAAAFGSADEVSAAKTLHEFMVDHPSLAFVGGLMSDQVGWRLATAAEVTALATLPSRQQLLGQLAGTVASPLRGFVNVLSGNLRGLVQVLQAAANAQA